MLKILLWSVSIFNFNVALNSLCLVEFLFVYTFVKYNIYTFLISIHIVTILFFYLVVYSFFCKVWLISSTLFFFFTLYHSLVKNSAILTFLVLCLKSFVIFILIVSIRIATPRFKIESLTKIGWLYCLLFILICLAFYIAGFFFF